MAGKTARGAALNVERSETKKQAYAQQWNTSWDFRPEGTFSKSQRKQIKKGEAHSIDY